MNDVRTFRRWTRRSKRRYFFQLIWTVANKIRIQWQAERQLWNQQYVMDWTRAFADWYLFNPISTASNSVDHQVRAKLHRSKTSAPVSDLSFNWVWWPNIDFRYSKNEEQLGPSSSRAREYARLHEMGDGGLQLSLEDVEEELLRLLIRFCVI